MEDNQELIEKCADAAANIPISIDLGSIELTLSDVLSLRNGMTIQFKRPQVFEASLKIADRAWADAQLVLKEDVIEVKINKIVTLQETLT